MSFKIISLSIIVKCFALLLKKGLDFISMKSQQIFVVFLKWILHLLKWTLLYYCFVLLSRKVLNFGKMIRVICINVYLYTFSAKFLHIFKIFIQLFWPVWPKFCKNYQDFRTCTEAVVISKKNVYKNLRLMIFAELLNRVFYFGRVSEKKVWCLQLFVLSIGILYIYFQWFIFIKYNFLRKILTNFQVSIDTPTWNKRVDFIFNSYDTFHF